MATPSNDYVENIIEISLFNNKEIAVQNSEINLASDSEIISIIDSFGELNYETLKTDNLKVVFEFTTPIEPGDSRTLIIKTKTSNNLIDKGDYYEYSLISKPSSNINDFEHILTLPRDVFLYTDESSFTQLVIPDAEITTQNSNIMIKWDLPLTKDETTVFIARFKQTEKPNYLIYIFLTITILLIGVLLGIIINSLYQKSKKRKAMKAADILNEREKAVLKVVIEKPGIKNSELKHKLGYTKSSLSKIIRKLELRGLIETKKYGKIKELYIGERMKKHF